MGLLNSKHLTIFSEFISVHERYERIFNFRKKLQTGRCALKKGGELRCRRYEQSGEIKARKPGHRQGKTELQGGKKNRRYQLPTSNGKTSRAPLETAMKERRRRQRERSEFLRGAQKLRSNPAAAIHQSTGFISLHRLQAW